MITELDGRTTHKYSGTGLTGKTVPPEPKRSFINIRAIDSFVQRVSFDNEMSHKKTPSSVNARVFIVEDHPVFREGLLRLLQTEGSLEVCGEAGDYESALSGIRKLRPDIVLVDLELPGKSGLELIKKVRALKLAVKLLVVSMYDEALYADRVLRAGGDGYIMKEENPQEIIHAIFDVLGGRIYISEEVLSRDQMDASKSAPKPDKRPLDDLTDLELRILELLGQGKSNIQIAEQLRLKASEIPGHCSQLRKKLNLNTSNALIHYAVCWVEKCVM
jgi:DNA-binding NarL/FixJ family response regulator